MTLRCAYLALAQMVLIGLLMARKILLVDDDGGTRKVLSHLLRLEGYVVDCCDEASSALCRLRDAAYDYLLTDHVMPGMSGLDLTHAARELQPELRCYVISGRCQPTDQALGSVAWLAKPVDIDDLLRVIGP